MENESGKQRPPAWCAGGRAFVLGWVETNQNREDGNFCWKTLAFLIFESYTLYYIEKEGFP